MDSDYDLNDDQVNALEALQKNVHALQPRGDSFDIGTPIDKPDYTQFVEQPNEFLNMLNLTSAQTENIKASLTGLGTAGAHKLLSKYIGDELASILGAAFSSHMVRRFMK